MLPASLVVSIENSHGSVLTVLTQLPAGAAMLTAASALLRLL